MAQITKSTLTLYCAVTSLICLGGVYACTLWGRDSIALIIIGRNLKTVGIVTAACTLTYSGIHLMNWWNQRHQPQTDEEQPLVNREEYRP